MRELSDAIRLLALRRHFADDWDAALGLIGCAVATDELPTAAPHEEATVVLPADPEAFAEAFVPAARADSWTLVPDEHVSAVFRPEPRGAESSRKRGARRPRAPWVAPFVLSPDAVSDAPPPRYVSVPRPHPRPRTPASRLDDPDVATRMLRLRDLLRRPGASRTVDVARLVEQVARLEPLTDLPRRKRRRRQPQMLLLVDTPLLVGPFASDVREIRDLVSRSLPAGATRVEGFRGDPRAGCGSGPIWTWEPFRPPATVSTVLVVAGDDLSGAGPRRPALESLMSDMIRRGHNAHMLWLGRATVPLAPWLRNTWHVLR